MFFEEYYDPTYRSVRDIPAGAVFLSTSYPTNTHQERCYRSVLSCAHVSNHLATGLHKWNWKLGPFQSVAYSPDGTVGAAGSEDGRIVVWDVDE